MGKSELSERQDVDRRGFLRISMVVGINSLLVLALPLSACGWRARARRRVRRRTRRIVRRNVAWRTVAGRRLLVVPTNVQPGDELVLADGRVATVTAVHTDSVVVTISGAETTFPVIYEGEI